MKSPLLTLTAAVLACVVLVACSQKGPAEAAINAAEQSVNQVKPDVVKYAPEQLKMLTAALNGARDSFNKGDYPTAIRTAQEIPGKATDAQAAATAKKGELTKAWNEMNASVPATLDAIKAKIDSLSAMKKLPKEFNAAKLAEAKTRFDAAQKAGAAAMEAYKAGNVADAVAKGKAVKAQVDDLASFVGVSPAAPAAAGMTTAAAPATR